MASASANGGNGTGVDLSRIAVREPPPPKAKRFYREVSVAVDNGRWRVLLDQKPMRTPLRHVLEVSTSPLAEAIAAEWQAQVTEIDPVSMPLTRLAATAIDRVGPEREAITETLLAYVGTDLLCYRATGPAPLKARQHSVWQPVLDWLARAHSLSLVATEGIVPVDQPAEAVGAAAAALSRLSADQLTVLQAVVSATGSFALGMALTHGQCTAAEVIAAAHLDEHYQNEQWGEDEEAVERRRRIAADIEAAARYLNFVGVAK